MSTEEELKLEQKAGQVPPPVDLRPTRLRIGFGVVAIIILAALYASLYLEFPFSIPSNTFKIIAPLLAGPIAFLTLDTLLSAAQRSRRSTLVVVSFLISVSIATIYSLDINHSILFPIVSYTFAGVPLAWIACGAILGVTLIFEAYRAHSYHQEKYIFRPMQRLARIAGKETLSEPNELNDAKESALSANQIQQRRKDDLQTRVADALQVKKYLRTNPPNISMDLSPKEFLGAHRKYANDFFQKFPQATKLSRKDIHRAQSLWTRLLIFLGLHSPMFEFSFVQAIKKDGKEIIGRVGRKSYGRGATTEYKEFFTQEEDEASTGADLTEQAKPKYLIGVTRSLRDKFQEHDANLAHEGKNYAKLNRAFAAASRYSETDTESHELKHYKVVELVEGQNLSELYDRHELNLKQTITLMLAIARKLQAVFTEEMLHRDIKPENIIVNIPQKKPTEPTSDKDDVIFEVTLIDLGGAIIGLTHRETGDGSKAGGSRPYMAPEIKEARKFGNHPDESKRKPADYTTQTDVYSLGVTFNTMIRDILPFDSDAKCEAGMDTAAVQPQTIYEDIQRLIGEMKSDDLPTRPKIEKVIERLEKAQSQLQSEAFGQPPSQPPGSLSPGCPLS